MVFSEPFPILHVADVERSVRFYCEAFGFEVGFRWPDEGPLEFAFLKLGDSGIGVGRSVPPDLPDWPAGRDLGSFQLCLHGRRGGSGGAAGGARRVTASREMPWGEKPAFFEDPDGNLLHVTAVVEPRT